jgi:RHS repeat-associated protein
VLWARHRAPESPSWACSWAGDPHKVPIDPNGNLTQKTEGSDTWVYTWNALNQLVKVEKNSIEQARFAYDPLGRRVEKVAAAITTSYTYDGADILREIRGSTTLKYLHGPGVDETLAVDDGTAVSYYHADGLGSVVRMTNAAGAVTLTRQYDAWGNIEAGAGEPGYAFTGREWDPEIGLYYYRARYYSASLGRFISEDPIGLAAGPNRYSYVDGNPVVFSDPSGLVQVRIDWRVVKGDGHFVGRVGDASPKCEPDCSGRYRLEFILPVSLTLYFGSGWCPSAEKHERLHAAMFLGNLNLAPLQEAEGKTYGSFGECYRAAYAAKARFDRSPFKSTYRPNQRWVDMVQIPCLAQF